MRRMLAVLLSAALFLFTGCAAPGQPTDDRTDRSYTQITQTEAKERMDRDDGHIVVDVRRQDEYDAGHIPGAVCIPNESIGTEPPEGLPDRDQIILIYCRSGNRSKQAAQKLLELGYTNLYEFGGILDWTGPIVTTEEENPTEAIRPVLVIEAEGYRFAAELEENSSAEALVKKLAAGPVEIELHDYGGFEKVGELPWELPRNDETITTSPGDVILYQGRQITIYYDENTWSFTRLAKIGGTTREALLEVLGEDGVTVTLRLVSD